MAVSERQLKGLTIEQMVQVGRELDNQSKSFRIGEIVDTLTARGYDPVGALIVMRERLVEVHKSLFDVCYPDAVFQITDIQRAGDLSPEKKDDMIAALEVGDEDQVVTLHALGWNVYFLSRLDEAGFSLIDRDQLGKLIK